MKPTQDTYPVFEANQVLTSDHLNEVFNYLDDQERLTRANLIGIGIVCGLNIQWVGATATVKISKGCGITSEGYLILEADDIELGSYRQYNVPTDVEYPQFWYSEKIADGSTKDTQYPMWELFPTEEPKTTRLSADFARDKVVLLFLELKKEGLRNCSPNNCDDKGSAVTVTVRHLLIQVDDLNSIISEANSLASGLTSSDVEIALTTRLNLPDLRMPRYDVPNSNPVTSNDILAAFHTVFQSNKLVVHTARALAGGYAAFKTILQDAYPSLPSAIAEFETNFGFLDNAPKETVQVRFLQYYYDFLDDLLRAYDEFRWKGYALMCACCPPEGLFPRHLMLGALVPASVKNSDVYRQRFLASSARCDCEELTVELVQLFKRLVEMIESFSNTPQLPLVRLESRIDTQIRITPSKLGSVELSDKAIPYYYTQKRRPALFELWNQELVRRGRANQNLSYRSYEFTPTPPTFVTNPLNFDIEPNNFLRIEGHLGKNYQRVLSTLLSLKSEYRLPIEIIALRTGAFDENMTVDVSKEECRFQDLETLYRTWREELRCFLCKEMQFFYDVPYQFASPNKNSYAPMEPLLKACAPGFMVTVNTVGDFFENSNWPKEIHFVVRMMERAMTVNLSSLVESISGMAEVLTQELVDVDFGELEKRYTDLEDVATAIKNQGEGGIIKLEGKPETIPWDEIEDRVATIIYACRQSVFTTIRDEYIRRIRELKQKQFLSYYLEKNPGIQHKAGVPLGGTFILVYHQSPDIVKLVGEFMTVQAFTKPEQAVPDTPSSEIISEALQRLQRKKGIAEDPDFRTIFSEFTGSNPAGNIFLEGRVSAAVEKIIAETVDEFDDGTVIADFYLPYLCCSDCAPVQYVLPPPPLEFSVQLGCTNADTHKAEATITPKGGEAPYSYKLDGNSFVPLVGHPVLITGSHTIILRDSAGAQSTSYSVTVPDPLTIGEAKYTDIPKDDKYQVTFTISGGVAPYKDAQSLGDVNGSVYTSKPVSSGKSLTVEITDSKGCTVKNVFTHKILKLPCKGEAIRCGYVFWLPAPTKNRPIQQYNNPRFTSFQFMCPDGKTVDLANQLSIKASVASLNTDFEGVVAGWIKEINAAVANHPRVQNEDWFKLNYSIDAKSGFCALVVEHFSCQSFLIRINEEFVYRDFNETRTVAYNEKGTEIDIAGLPATQVPLFRCEQTNKNSPKYEWTPVCSGVNFAPIIKPPVIQNNSVSFVADYSGSEKPVAFLWEIEDASPSLLVGDKVNTRLVRFKPHTTMVRLTGFSKLGCAVSIEQTVDSNLG